jgi:hypothetical protein
LAVVIVKDESFLLRNSSIFIKLWEADVTQSDNLLGHDLAGQGFYILAGRKVFESNSRG